MTRAENLFREHHQSLVDFARKLLASSDPEAAPGVVQELYILVLEHPGELPLDSEESRKWAMKSIWYLAQNRRRREEVRRCVPLSDELHRSRADPDVWFEVCEAVTNLPEEERMVVELRFWYGMTYEEVAGVLGLSIRSSKRRWRTAKAKLQGLLA
jgi:RNA polymerase sigma factor (sigma-70 family)